MSQKLLYYEDEWHKGTTPELIASLREQYKLGLRPLGELFDMSHETVRKILAEQGITGHIEYPELNDPQFYDDKTDEEIMELLGVSRYKVEQSRIALGIKPTRYSDVRTRHQSLCEYLWGDGYTPGHSFTQFIKQMSASLSDAEKKYILAYIRGQKMYPVRYKQVATDRAKKALKTLLEDTPVEHFITMGIINAIDDSLAA